MTLLLLACAGPADKPAPDTDTADTAADTGTSDTSDTAEDTGDSDTVYAFDEDRDHVRSDEGDCDDADPRVHPGAEDPCDAVDQDCDGVAQPEGSCAEVVQLEVSASAAWTEDDLGDIHLYEADTDYDGDGVPDLVTLPACVSFDGALRCNTNVALLPGRMPDGEQDWTEAGAPFWVADPNYDWFGDAGNAGDFDGDGSTDLFVTSRGCWPDRGALYLMLGPSERWPREGAWLEDAADGWWRGAEDGDCFGDDLAGGHDVDGDGLADLLVSSMYVPSVHRPTLNFISGRSAGLPAGERVSDEVWFEDDVYANFAVLPDMDGDGIGEAVSDGTTSSTGERSVGFFPPEVLIGGPSGATISEAVDHVPSDPDVWVAFHRRKAELGDVDGDGLVDVAVVTSKASTSPDGRYCYGVLYGATGLRDSPIGANIGSLTCLPFDEASQGHEDQLGGDIDGDGIPDLVVNGPYDGARGNDYLACILPSSRIPREGWSMLEDVRPYCYTIGDDEGSRGAAVDLDGDGLAEILGARAVLTPDGSDYVSSILIAPGFALPVGDDSRW